MDGQPLTEALRCAKGISTTTVGLGRHFNEELMIGMARAGGGQQYYGQTAEDLFDGFDEELALLEALCLRKLRVKLITGAGVIAEPLGLVRQNPDRTYTLSDLAWGTEAWLLVRLHITGMVSNDPAQPVMAAVAGAAQRALLPEQMALVNTLCWMQEAGRGEAVPRRPLTGRMGSANGDLRTNRD